MGSEDRPGPAFTGYTSVPSTAAHGRGRPKYKSDVSLPTIPLLGAPFSMGFFICEVRGVKLVASGGPLSPDGLAQGELTVQWEHRIGMEGESLEGGTKYGESLGPGSRAPWAKPQRQRQRS